MVAAGGRRVAPGMQPVAGHRQVVLASRSAYHALPRRGDTALKKSDFHYELPRELIAQVPLAQRSASRLLLADARSQALSDHRFEDLPGLLRPGDLLVFNDTRVLPARLFGRKDSGGAVEILIERITSAREARAQLGVSKKPKAGGRIVLDDGSIVTVCGREGEFFLLRFEGEEPLERLLGRLGRMPLPPYIERAADQADAARYQTVFARQPGAVAAPTAGLHFDAALLARLAARNVALACVTLHVGAGTFSPVREPQLASGRLHAERVRVGADLVVAVAATRRAGGRVIAVGTTVVRALETAAAAGVLAPFEGETDLFIRPGYGFRVVDALVTNFHLPRSSLLMLVCAFAGRERVLDAYRHAVARGYRFFSYGDAMILQRSRNP